MHNHIRFGEPHAGDADIATAAPAALYDVPLLGGKPGGEHIVDLAGDAPQVAGQLVALDFRRAVSWFNRFKI